MATQANNASAACARRIAWAVLGSLLALFSVLLAPAAEKNKEQIDLLIARNEIQDPYFRHSVVLMLPETQTQLVVGLIINKPTRLTVGKLFPDTPELRGQAEPVYFGGPVDVRTPSIVFQSSSAPKDAIRLYGDVYLTFDSDLITKALQGPQSGSRARLFLGRAQWAPGQLQNEIQRGSWYRIQADGKLVFSSHPENLWPTLHARAAPSKFIRYRLPPRSGHPSERKAAAM
ncbi:MAG TPA: YqgE/AlgH family protein [Terriglobia bacterium]|nr:YqgE/AlgH family protein [Terriglobia bacterium]